MNEAAIPGPVPGGDGASAAPTPTPRNPSPSAHEPSRSAEPGRSGSDRLAEPGASGRQTPGTQKPGAQTPGGTAQKRRRRRGGRGRGSGGGQGSKNTTAGQPRSQGPAASPPGDREPDELPKPERQGRPSAADAEKSLVGIPAVEGQTHPQDVADTEASPDAAPDAPTDTAPRPRIGDTRPAPSAASQDAHVGSSDPDTAGAGSAPETTSARKRRRRGGRGRSSGKAPARVAQGRQPEGVRSGVAKPVTALTGGEAIELDDDVFAERRGKTRNGKPVGRYLMAVHVQPEATQIAILEGRALIEHYVARPADDIHQIHGNIYLGRVQNVLPGMEAAFIDIGTPKNAVLYRGDVHYDAEDIEVRDDARIENLLQPRQTILCQVTKNPIMHKGARLTQEVSLPGRFVVLVPNSKTLGISKRLPDAERKRLRKIVDKARPEGHGVIVRTAAEDITAPEIERDLARLVAQWTKIEELAAKASAPALLYREPDMALRVIREEFSRDFRSVMIDDKAIFDDIHDYVASVSPALAERVSYFDVAAEPLSLFERHHIVEQLRRGLDRKVWLPSGGSLIIEHTEALTVIDVNTGKNVGKSNLEDTVFDNNLEAAVEIARQLRLRDVGGIIVIDFVDMEVRKNRAEVVRVFREALARDKTRTQVFDISELGLVQMTRKRIGEGLLESFSEPCATCEGRGVVFDQTLFQA